jgi:hypothetical protein
MPAADTRRLLDLDIDRLSPLPPELVHFDFEIVDRGGGGGPQRVLLGIIDRIDAAELLAAARRDGHAPTAIGARTGAGADPRFDFLPAVLEAAGGAGEDKTRRYFWIAAVFLILVNLAVLVGRDIIDVARLREAVEAQQPGVIAVQRLRGRVAAEDARRRDLIVRGVQNDPLRLLNTLSRTLPAGASVQHLDWNGNSLRIVGIEHADSDVAAAIRGAGAFVDPRVSTGTPTGTETRLRPFDLTVAVAPPARR